MARIKAGKYKEKAGVESIKASLRAQWRRMASIMAKESDEKYRKAARDIQIIRNQEGR